MKSSISTVTVTRVSTAQVAVEHPAEWTDAQIKAAVQERAIDIGTSAQMWCAETRTTLGAIVYGRDTRDEMDGAMEMPEPIDIGPADEMDD